MSAEAPAISDYGFLSDCTTAALVSSAGSVDWWCPARFDAPSVFGRLLDPAAGYWSITPVSEVTTARRYLEDSLVVRTEHRGDNGTVAVTDTLAFEPGARHHDIGLRSPHTLIRRVEATSGHLRLHIEVAPRMEYGLTVPQWKHDGDRWIATAGPVTLVLTGAPPLSDDEGTLRGELELSPGNRAEMQLTYLPTYGGPDEPAWADLDDTAQAWRSWNSQHSYDGEYADVVRRSATVLQGLTYAPTGAVTAAATTSLPEEIGGEANWDYRFAWVRDISLTLQALWVAACPDEADRFFRWLARAAGRTGGGSEEQARAPLQIMFGVEGERDLSERALPHLAGYRDSRPVRVGNDAWDQRQLDVLGEVLFAAHLLRDSLGELDDELQGFLAGLADTAAACWHQRDAGMWEARDTDRHYTSSKVMCWVALDRAVAMADRLGPYAKTEEWARARDDIHAAVLEKAWSESAGAYAGAFGSDQLDASVLLLPLVGFLPFDDERILRTVDAIAASLGDGALVRRWSEDTSGFLLCSYWLVECLARSGRVEEARRRFEAVTAYAGELGLLAEGVDPGSGAQLGNYPQAFSHVGLINAAWAITEEAKATSKRSGRRDL